MSVVVQHCVNRTTFSIMSCTLMSTRRFANSAFADQGARSHMSWNQILRVVTIINFPHVFEYTYIHTPTYSDRLHTLQTLMPACAPDTWARQRAHTYPFGAHVVEVHLLALHLVVAARGAGVALLDPAETRKLLIGALDVAPPHNQRPSTPSI